jgi:hypothetical protein
MRVCKLSHQRQTSETLTRRDACGLSLQGEANGAKRWRARQGERRLFEKTLNVSSLAANAKSLADLAGPTSVGEPGDQRSEVRILSA